MVLFEDLLKKENITAPDWVGAIRLDEEWEDSVYALVDGIHAWRVDNEFQHLLITWDGEQYKFEGFDDEDNVIYTEILSDDLNMIT